MRCLIVGEPGELILLRDAVGICILPDQKLAEALVIGIDGAVMVAVERGECRDASCHSRRWQSLA